ncbi:hypothetical protein [Streptomyces sp. NPDC029041]|uniref:hypothetical protein n=1 Tax=Streptomyces sp. NPDC029041 TaxID=3155727 RepID=UPI0033C13169
MIHFGKTEIPVSVFVGVVTGAVLTIIVQFITGIIRNYRSYRFLIRMVRDEIADIAQQVDEREKHIDLVIPMYPSLPTSSWDAMVESPNRRYMSEKRRKAISSLYSAVGKANRRLELLPTAVEISQLASDSKTRDAYHDEAVNLLKLPLPNIAAALPAAQDAVEQKKWSSLSQTVFKRIRAKEEATGAQGGS